MAQHTLTRVGVLACSAALCVALMPSCTFRFGPGSAESNDSDNSTDPDDSGEDTIDPDDPGEDTMTSDGSTEPAPEEDAFSDAIASADPQQLAVTTARMSYALYLINGSIEAEGLAPEALDEATLSMLVERYLPWALWSRRTPG
ncbi:hypothetical protein [Sorangium sp. So ce1099]|uniref:hypothetical protein n=1 Tax=Sorangium sp. So ce1099 TaxID=3133331 RepID=UPI003F5E2FDE